MAKAKASAKKAATKSAAKPAKAKTKAKAAAKPTKAKTKADPYDADADDDEDEAPKAKTGKGKGKTKVESVEAPEPKERKSSRLNVMGRTVVITGTVPGMTRAEAQSRLEAVGATCKGSVSKSVDLVFAMDDAGSKKAEAERLGITVLDKDSLFYVIGHVDNPKSPTKIVSADLKEKVAERKSELFEEDGFKGKTVVITGTLSKGRNEIKALLEAAGADVTGSVSANTHYLITGAGVGAAKTSKAAALGVTVIDESTMNTMLGWGG